jgi:hypothetical protein
MGPKKDYHSKQKVNSNEGSNLDAQNEKLMFANDKKKQQLSDGNSGARTGGHELGKELSPIVHLAAYKSKKLSQRMMFQHRLIRSADMLAASEAKVRRWYAFPKAVLLLRLSSLLGHQLLVLHSNQNPTWHRKYFCPCIQTKRSILGVTIRHGVPKDIRKIRRLQVDIRIIGDDIINFHRSTCQCMDKGIHIQVHLLVCHGFSIVLDALWWVFIFYLDCYKVIYMWSAFMAVWKLITT